MRCESEEFIFKMKVVTMADVARAAAKIGQICMAYGYSKEHSAKVAAHEFCHAFVDSSRLVAPAYFKLVKIPDDIKFYYYNSEQDPQKVMEICSAPSRLGKGSTPMSDEDILLYRNMKLALKNNY